MDTLHNEAAKCSMHGCGQLTLASLKGQNFGFPLRPYFSRYAPFFSVVIA